jgi:hypothetical protein
MSMTRHDFQSMFAHYESERRQFETAHSEWCSRKAAKTAETQFFRTWAIILSCLFIIAFFLFGQKANLSRIAGLFFWASVLFTYGEKWDAWRNRKRRERFNRNNPEPIFRLERPVWIDDDNDVHEAFNFSWHEEVLSPRMVLGVEETASLDEVKRAYRGRIKQCHPDKFAQLGAEVRQVAEEHAKALNIAYASVLAEGS